MTENTNTSMEKESFRPRIIAFVCKWCTYAGADLAGMSRLEYSANVETIMLPCSGRIDITMVLRAFMLGADGVIVSGCHPGDCHYTAGNFRARRRWALLRDLLDTLGFDLNRLKLAWISAAEGNKWAKTVQQFADDIQKMGPYTALRTISQKHEMNAALSPIPFTLEPSDKAKDGKAKDCDKALLKAVSESLKEGKISKLLGWRSRPTLKKAIPGWFSKNEELEDMVSPGIGNLARLMDEPSVKGQGNIGVVARFHELAALNVLAQEAAFDPETVTVFELDENGALKNVGALSELTKDVLAQMEPGQLTGHSPETLKQLDQLMQHTAEERLAFWTAHASNCVRCYACRGTCPMCRCNRCYADRNQPQWFPTASDGPGTFSWHIVRAFHLAGRCIGCGACQDVCPSNIPLNLLNAAAARSAMNNFSYQAGTLYQDPPLQSDYKSEDPESFIE